MIVVYAKWQVQVSGFRRVENVLKMCEKIVNLQN